MLNGGGAAALSADLCDAGARVSRRATATSAHAHAAREAANTPDRFMHQPSRVDKRMRASKHPGHPYALRERVQLHSADYAQAGRGMSRIPDPHWLRPRLLSTIMSSCAPSSCRRWGPRPSPRQNAAPRRDLDAHDGARDRSLNFSGFFASKGASPRARRSAPTTLQHGAAPGRCARLICAHANTWVRSERKKGE